MKPKQPIETIDWRYRVATYISEDTVGNDGKIIYKKGSPITLATFVKHDGKEISFGDPSASALFLNQSQKNFGNAQNLHPFTGEVEVPDKSQPTKIVYDYLEAIIASIIFAYTALEAFTNEEIPESYIYEAEGQTESGIFSVRQFNKEQLERHFSLSEKLATVLPVILDVPSPKGNKEWEGFVHLKRLRDRIIHMKSADRKHSQHGEMYPDSLWNDLLKPNQPNYPIIAKNIILCFKSKESAHWLKYCPF